MLALQRRRLAFEGARVRRIVALLESSEDYLPDWAYPRTSTGSMVARSALPGPGPAELRPCHHCEATGRVVGNAKCKTCWNGSGASHHCSPCPTCEGKLRLWYDPMLNERRPVDAPPPIERKRESRGVKARRRSGGAKSDLGDRIALVVRASERAERSASYAELRVAMEHLRSTVPEVHTTLKACFVEGRYGPTDGALVDEASAELIASGLERLSELMPDEIRLPPEHEQRLHSATRTREAQRLVFAEGLTRRQAARRMGIREGELRALLRRP